MSADAFRTPKYTFNVSGVVDVYGEYDEMDAREVAESYFDRLDMDLVVGDVVDMDLGDEHA